MTQNPHNVLKELHSKTDDKSMKMLLTYQQKWVADQTDVTICEKSRRVGLSWADAAKAALIASQSRDAGGMDCFYIGYEKEMARQYIRDVAFWAQAYNQVVELSEEEEEIWYEGQEEKSVFVYRIQFASGFKVEALSSKPRSLRSKQGRVCLDEAAFHDELDELIKAAMAFLMWGGKVAIISTHDGIENRFNELISDTRAGKTKFSLHRITLDDALEQGLYRRICLVTKKKWSQEAEEAWRKNLFDFYGDGADEELLCIPRSSSENWIPRPSVEAAMDDSVEVLYFHLNDDYLLKSVTDREQIVQKWIDEVLAPAMNFDEKQRTLVGYDFARSGDRSVLFAAQEDRYLRRNAKLCIDLHNIPFEAQKSIVFWVFKRLKRLNAAFDARGNGQWLAETTQLEFGRDVVECVQITQGFYLNTMPKLKSDITDGQLSLPKDSNILGDFGLVRVRGGIAQIPDNKHTQGDDGFKRHGDFVVAAALMTHASEQEEMVYEYHSISKTSYSSNSQSDFEPEDYWGHTEDSFAWTQGCL